MMETGQSPDNTKTTAMWRSKIAWQMAVGVFLAIFVTTTLLVFPTNWRKERQEAQQLAQMNLSILQGLLAMAADDGSFDPFNKVGNTLAKTATLNSVTLLNAKGETVASFGTPIDYQWLNRLSAQHSLIKENGPNHPWLYVYWTPEQLNAPYSAVARINPHQLTQPKYFYFFEVEGFALLVGAIVAFLVLLLVSRLLLKPLLRLGAALDNISLDPDHPQRYRLKHQHSNEMGKIMNHFNQMLTSLAVTAFPEENPSPVLRADINGTLIYANPASKVFLDYWSCQCGDTLDKRWQQLFQSIFSLQRSQTIELPIAEKIFLVSICPILTKRYINVYAIEITARKQQEQKLLHLAHHDALTGLANRALFTSTLDQLINWSLESNKMGCVIFCAINEYSSITKTLGTTTSELLLIAVADHLKKNRKGKAYLARVAENEFAIGVGGLDSPDQINEQAWHYQQALQGHYIVAEKELNITCRVGIAMFPTDGKTAEQVTQAASLALFYSLDKHSPLTFYQNKMSKELQQRHELLTDLHKAISEKQFIIHYQPQVILRNQQLFGVEALVRWNHPTFGLLSPDKFIPLAEESGLIIPLGELILSQACQQLHAWQAHFDINLRVSVNLSTIQFRDKALLKFTQNLLNEYQIQSNMLEFEITESALMEDIQACLISIKQIKELGIFLAIDDFGTGYSSLNYLQQLPVDRLKIDRSFTSDIDTNADSRAIARAIIDLGHSLGMSVIAEGVETEAHQRTLIDLGCDEIQGYLISKPLPPEEFTAFIQHYLTKAS